MSNRKDPGRIVTFYSYKGGTGRTMLLANTGWLLASAGHHVLLVDWDLEAPGLHRYMAPFLTDPQMTDSNGLIDLVVAYAAEAVEPASSSTPRSPDWYREKADVLDYSVSINWKYPSGGTLSLLPAGRQGSAYGTKVNTFSWQNFYDRLGGHGFFEALKQSMREQFDFILIDSRTGVSDTSGICTVQFPDALIVCFTLNNQSIEGAAAVANSVMEQKQAAGFRVFPVATRLDNSESDKLLDRWNLAKQRFSAMLPVNQKPSYWDDVFVPYVPKFGYEEILAVFANRLDDPPNLNLLAQAKRLTEIAFGVETVPDAIPDNVRANVLDHFAGRNVAVSPAEAQRIAENIQRKADAEKATVIEQAKSEARQEADARLSATVRKKRLQWGMAATIVFVIAIFATSYYQQRQVTFIQQTIAAGDDAAFQMNWDKALAQYNKAIGRSTDNAELYAKRATVLARLERPQESLADWQQAVKLQPNDVKFLFGRGQSRLGNGDRRGAIEDLSVVTARDPTNQSAVELLARAQEDNNQLNEAVANYSKLIDKAPANLSEILIRRATVQLKLQQREGAIQDLQRVARDFPNSAPAAYAETQLKTLGVATEKPMPARPSQPVVFIQYSDEVGKGIADELRKVLQKAGFKTPAAEAKGFEKGEVRYFFGADRPKASTVKEIVEIELAKQRYLIALAIQALDGKRLKAPPGQIEVWLPPLKGQKDRGVIQSAPRASVEQRAYPANLMPGDK